MQDLLDGTTVSSAGSSAGSNTNVLPSLEAVADNRRRLAELEDEIAELCAQIDAATYRLLCAVSEFDRRDGWHDGFASCAHWLSYRVGIGLVTAREKVRVARALDGLPGIGEALATGSISYSKVRELTRIATPESEADLVQLARAGTASHVGRVAKGPTSAASRSRCPRPCASGRGATSACARTTTACW